MNQSGPLGYTDFDDMISIGSQIFNVFQGIQYNYETNKLAFDPYRFAENPNNPPIKPAKKGLKTWAIILIAVGVIALIGGVVGYIIHSKKKLRTELNSGTKYESF